jgi:NAD(P)-dependent dehydrogenase (short-subunit alcohol dehydrogenase family)
MTPLLYVSLTLSRFENIGAANMAGVIGSGKKIESSITSLTETSDEEWNRIIDINVGGTKNCLRAELRHMSSGGSLVNASSVSALIGSPWNVAYSTSKAAIIGLTKSLAQEVGRHGIRVNAIAP